MSKAASKVESQKWDVASTKHQCKLPEEEPLLIMYISDGCCVSLRRYIRRKTLINPKNKMAKNIYNSYAGMNKEMEVHMKRYYYIIHPYSDFKMGWETFMIVVVITSLFYYPSLIYTDAQSVACLVINSLYFILFLLDLFMNFNSGYYSDNENRVVLDRKSITLHYLKTWFPFDFICLLNVNRLFITHPIMTVLNYINILRISMIVRYLPAFTEYTQVTFYRFHFSKLVLITLIIVWWASSLLYLAVSIYNEEWLKNDTQYGMAVTCFYRVNYLIFMIGYGEGHSNNSEILIFEILCWITGTILKIFCFAEVFQIVNKYTSGKNLYHQRIQRLKLMMQTKRLPANTRSRILQYFDFRFQKSYFVEKDILACLSEQVRNEVLGHNCRKLIGNSEMFDHLPPDIIDNIVSRMQDNSVIYLKNDVITLAGSKGGSMFFVHDGAVAVYTKDGLEVCHVNAGECFGECAMIKPDSERLATVLAVDACELYVLKSTDFEAALEREPKLLMKSINKLEEKLKYVYANDNKKLYTL